MIALALFLAGLPAPFPIDFERDVAPILEGRCIACHDATHKKGGLSLATRIDAMAGGRSGEPAFDVSRPDSSPLIVVLRKEGDDPPRMPKGKPPVPESDIHTLLSWIEDGANWPQGRTLVDRSAALEFDRRCDLWSLRPIVHPTVPRDTKNPIDSFVDARLAELALTPGPLADKKTLIRRVTYDLTGLPPTPEEVAQFVADSAQDAYLRLVDRLLASPRFGERFARFWLDLVHYGETHGYDKDKPRPNAWPYRDYVIASFDSDKPYSRFVTEQLAGDVLYPNDPSALVATGFIAAGPWDFVGHVELREGTTDKAITRNLDRDDMVMNTMSTFASMTVHCARCHDHKFDAITQDDYYSLQAVFAGVERADREFDADPEIAARRAAIVRERATLQRVDAGPSDHLGYHSDLVATADATREVTIDLGESVRIDRIVLVPAHEVYGGWPGPGFGFPVRFDVAIADDPSFANPRIVSDHTGADFANPGDSPLSIETTGSARFVRVRATKLWQRTGDFAFALGELVVIHDRRDVAMHAHATSTASIEAPPRWSLSNLTDGDTPFGAIGVESVAGWIDRVERLARLDREFAALPPPSKVFAAAKDFTPNGAFTPSPSPREIRVLARGDVNSPRDVAIPGAPRCVRALPSRFDALASGDEGARRAALANWLVDPKNPLVPRSIVNRVWLWHFGRGLVDTPSDFGHLGAPPTHPELLDFLASWFLDTGGSLKQLHRLIVTSEAYRRSSFATPLILEKDAENRFLAHAPRARLDAEQIHDALLSISGALDLRRGGPSDRQFAFKDDHSPVYDYEPFDRTSPTGNRRAIYRFLVRSAPDPFMECLDCPDASLLTPRRNVTITALQALAMLNDPFVLTQCDRLARRLRNDAPDDLPGQIRRAFALALNREPRPAELDAFVAHANAHGLPAACRVLVNLDEFLFID